MSEGKKVCTKGVFELSDSALKTQVPQQAKKRFGVYQKACFQGKRKENTHIHQRSFKVVGDPFAQYWCLDFGLLKSEKLEKAGTVDFKKHPAQKVGTRSRQCGPKVPGRFAFPGDRGNLAPAEIPEPEPEAARVVVPV